MPALAMPVGAEAPDGDAGAEIVLLVALLSWLLPPTLVRCRSDPEVLAVEAAAEVRIGEVCIANEPDTSIRRSASDDEGWPCAIENVMPLCVVSVPSVS